MTEAAIALGSNIGDKAGNLDRAVAALAATSGIRVTARSRYYRTAPWGIADQDWFVNAVVLVETALSPRALLEASLAIEARLGRVRGRRWGSRLIDLDILTFGDLVVDEPGLVIPHPRMMERAFVLAPLAELMADRVIGEASVAEALARLGTEGVSLLDETALLVPGE